MNKWHKIGLTVGMGAAVLTTAHFINNFIFNTSTAANVTGKRIRCNYQWKFGNIAYTVAGEGSPLLLVHDLNNCSSGYEWDSVINYFAKKHTVYALDLLGCGHSDKPNLTYTSFMYTQLLNDFVCKVIKSKTDVVVSVNAAPSVIMSAYNNHDIFDRIILVNPQAPKDALKGPDKFSNIRRIVLSIPVIGTSVYNILMNRQRLTRFLSKNVFKDGVIPSDYLHACHENAHLGLSSAKNLFISTECHYTTVSISKAVSELDNCIYIISGMNCDNTDTISIYTELNPAIEVVKIQDSKLYPQLEQPVEFVRQAEIFLS